MTVGCNRGGEKPKRRVLLMTGRWLHKAPQLEVNGGLHLTKPFKLKTLPTKFCGRIGPRDNRN